MDWAMCTTCSDSEDDALQEADDFKDTACTVNISKGNATPDIKPPDIKKQRIIEAGKQEPVTQEDPGKTGKALQVDSSTAKNVVSQILNPGGSKVQKKRKKKNLIQDGQGHASKLIKVSKGPQESEMPCVSGGSSTNTFQTNCKPDNKALLSQFLDWVENNKAEYAAEVPNLCTKCNVTFSSPALLDEHSQNAHSTEHSFSCPDCTRTFLTPGGVTNHRIAVHNAQNIYQCRQCDAIVKNASLLNLHYSIYHELSKCSKCSKWLSSLELLKQHQWEVHNIENLFTCSVCSQTFTDFTKFIKHRKSHMIESKTAQLHFRCPDCSKTFPSTDVLNQHYRIDHGLAKCCECSEDFLSLVLLQKHKWDVHKLLTCAVCRETFINFNQYKKHRETHTFESTVFNSTFKKPAQLSFRCPDCSKTFPNTGALNEHYRIDHGFAKCFECREEFSSLVLLKKHKWDVHKLLTCAVCRETFINFNQYKKHRDTHTFESAVSNSTFKNPAQLSFRCPGCNKTFPSTGVVNQHYRIDHGLAKCFECSEEFSSLLLLKKHKWDVHKLLTCAVCRETFINFNQYKKHRDTHTFEYTVSNSTFNKPAQLSFRCPDCSKFFPNTGVLNEHYRIDHGFAKCFECREEFSSLLLLKKHKWDVHKLLTCAVCRETFANFIIFKQHRASHTFEFTLSNSTFKMREQLQRNFRCPDCNNTFPSPYVLDQHYSIYHGLAKCFECSEGFSTLFLLKKHKWEVHKLLTCAVCRETFTNFVIFKEHRAIHTFACTMCNSTFNTPALLRKHEQSHV